MASKRTPRPRQPAPGTTGPRSTGRLQQAIDETVRREIARALREAGGNMAEAARELGISYVSFWKRLRALGISPDDYRK